MNKSSRNFYTKMIVVICILRTQEMRQVKVYKEEEEVSESEDERETKTMHTKADKETLSDEDCDDDMLLG